MKIAKYVILILISALIIMQFFTIDKSVPPVNDSDDFLAFHNPPQQVEDILVSTCYDCHSYKTEYPWYSNVAPVSWWLADHIEHGRGHLNFSEWSSYEEKRRKHKIEEIAEEVQEEKMPLPSYTWAHSDARLSAEEREVFVKWFESLK